MPWIKVAQGPPVARKLLAAYCFRCGQDYDVKIPLAPGQTTGRWWGTCPRDNCGGHTEAVLCPTAAAWQETVRFFREGAKATGRCPLCNRRVERGPGAGPRGA